MNFLDLIANRRDGRIQSQAEFEMLAKGAATSTVPDYQLSAWLMAAFLRPLSGQETVDLTVAMAESGDRLDLSELPKPWIDKHSTGGVGDKTTIVALPILASCGLSCVKMSGRGLGITGGTVDKLASIPGFRIDLSPQELIDQAKKIGLALTGQTPNLAPADKVLYALRDVTGTVASVPLIVSSILSKKIAAGAETIVLDVKCGSGAFMTTFAEAKELAQALVTTGKACGLNVRAAITDMDQPLGRCIGNALEIAEAIRTLHGEEGRFQKLCQTLCAHALAVAMPEYTESQALALVQAAISSGQALEKCRAWFKAQGATEDVIENPDRLPQAPVQMELFADEAGWVKRVDAQVVGQTVVDLGGGRLAKEDLIDPAVGVECLVEVGARVEEGQVTAIIHASHREAAELARAKLHEGIQIVSEPTEARPLILEML